MVWQWHVPPNSWINRLKIWLGWLRRWCDPMSVLLYASETWTLTVADSKSLDAFHMKCQRRILGITWHQFVRNEEIATRTGLPPLSTTICCRRSAIFGHLARLGDEVPAHKALHSCIRLSQGRLPDPTRKRRPGRLRADQWKLAIKRGHGGRATLRSQDYATSWPDLSCDPMCQKWHKSAQQGQRRKGVKYYVQLGYFFSFLFYFSCQPLENTFLRASPYLLHCMTCFGGDWFPTGSQQSSLIFSPFNLQKLQILGPFSDWKITTENAQQWRCSSTNYSKSSS